jgi:hypothetical protein
LLASHVTHDRELGQELEEACEGWDGVGARPRAHASPFPLHESTLAFVIVARLQRAQEEAVRRGRHSGCRSAATARRHSRRPPATAAAIVVAAWRRSPIAAPPARPPQAARRPPPVAGRRLLGADGAEHEVTIMEDPLDLSNEMPDDYR